MAYLTHISPTCPNCGLTGAVQIVVSTGLASRPGSKPHRRFRTPGPFTPETDDQGHKTGRLLCPADATPVWTNAPGASAP